MKVIVFIVSVGCETVKSIGGFWWKGIAVVENLPVFVDSKVTICSWVFAGISCRFGRALLRMKCSGHAAVENNAAKKHVAG